MKFARPPRIVITICSVVLVLLLIPTFAVAKKTPTVCDELKGKAYGLCNAYCEALDCDWDPNASENACEALKSNYSSLTGESEFPCETMSLGCVVGDSGEVPQGFFDVDDGNDYGSRELGITVPPQSKCDPSISNCTPSPIVVGFHGYGQTGSSPYSWKSRLEGKGAAVGFISLYPTGDMTPNSFTPDGSDPNWAVPSCQEFDDGCLEKEYCDWCGDINEDNDVSTQREIDFTRAIVKWTMDNYCVDPRQIFATGFSNGGLWSHELARNPATSKLFKAIVPVDGVDQAGVNDKLKWISAPPDGDSPWVLHVNEVFDRFEPYDGRTYDDWAEYGSPSWIYPPVLQIFAEYLKNDDYSTCGFSPDDVGNRFGAFAAGGVVPEGYRRLYSLEGEGQDKFFCFTKDADGETCEKLAICLWDGGEPGDDLEDPHSRAGQEWTGGTDPGTGGTLPMDIMWRFMKASVGVPY